jgi:dipeptidyl aminopeptidase
MNNDLYVSDLINHTRVTFDGSATIFNGVPDWVYEEEVFSRDSALWWSPDSTHLAYLRLNETAVPEFHLQMYTNINATYPEEVAIKYPKAGAPNPLASLHLYSLTLDTNIMLTSNSTTKATVATAAADSTLDEFEDADRIITDVTWATANHTYLLFKQTNRVQDVELTSLVDIDDHNLNKSTISNVRTYKPDDGGWVDSAQTMVYIPNSKSTDKTVRYLDVIDDGEGFMHLAVLNQNGQAKWLTSGEWEVISGSVVVDQSRRLV